MWWLISLSLASQKWLLNIPARGQFINSTLTPRNTILLLNETSSWCKCWWPHTSVSLWCLPHRAVVVNELHCHLIMSQTSKKLLMDKVSSGEGANEASADAVCKYQPLHAHLFKIYSQGARQLNGHVNIKDSYEEAKHIALHCDLQSVLTFVEKATQSKNS